MASITAKSPKFPRPDDIKRQAEEFETNILPHCDVDQINYSIKQKCEKNTDTNVIPYPSSARNVRVSSVINSNCTPQNVHSKTPMTNHGSEIQIGGGSELFELTISIEGCRYLSQLLILTTSEGQKLSSHDKCWLSFRVFGKVIQSDIFSLSDYQHSIQNHIEFTPTMDAFRIRSSECDLKMYFETAKNSTLRIHVCMEGAVLGTAFVNWRALFEDNDDATERRNEHKSRIVRNDYLVESKLNRVPGTRPECDSPPSIAVRLGLDSENRFGNNANHASNKTDGLHEQHSFNTVDSNSCISSQQSYSEQSESQRNCVGVDKALSPINWQSKTEADAINYENDYRSKLIREKEEMLKSKEADLAAKEKLLMESLSALKMKQLEWEQWRRQEQINWHEKLREKETATMKSVEEKICKVEQERIASLEASRVEYEKLEARLQKSLLEVETKERHLKDLEASHQNERKRKLAELELREKLMKEEMKHVMEIEVNHFMRQEFSIFLSICR